MVQYRYETGHRSAGDVPPTRPILAEERRAGGLWFPLLVLVVLVAGAAYYFLGDYRAPSPNVRADSNPAISKSQPHIN